MAPRGRGPATAGGAPRRDAPYKEVRGLTRGIAVLRAMNAMPGGLASITDIARATGIHRTTVKRLLETLRAERLVHRAADDGPYALAREVRRLSEGYVGGDWIDRAAAPEMFARLRELAWPCDVATPDAGEMVIRESTHRGSLLSQHRAMIGARVPMLVSALGRAWLAACSADEREATLAILRARGDALARDAAYVKRVLAATRAGGYARNDGEWAPEASFAAIALPVRDGRRALGAVNLVFPRDAVTPRELRERFLPALRALADAISAGISGGRSD